ncbi:MAG: bifunctional hydroxymethylpyrimidine kinase/phosphomethylpyrimidine kinase [Candidatus Omnitrophica bacterium]|nr:bifunctional hydroxymethylpyrimidine kinase/phosphomethylpyrimidine kinase [Candidatus Omnitrophota bacterium]
MSILVVGSVALDTVKTPLGKGRNVLGGSATYFSISAGFFNPVSLVAVVGSDFPSKYLSLLKSRGIDLRGLTTQKGETFKWEGEYGWDFADPKTLSTCLNVFAKFDPKIPAEYKKNKYLFLANIDPEIQENVLKQLSPKLVVCDTMNYWIENKRNHLLKLLKKVDIFLLNESEARMLTLKENIIKAARALIKLGPQIVIIKRGEHGSLLFSQRHIFSIPAFLLEKVVDPTGAGDTFAGGVLGYLAKCDKFNQANLKKAVAYGAVMATFAVEDFSVRRLVTIRYRDVARRFKDFQRLSCF